MVRQQQVIAADTWEYMVIHLNVEPGPAAAAPGPAKGNAGDSADEAATARPVFSESFLKKEFPHLYESRPAPERSGGSPPQHPAQQLQTFLNGHGAQGWELIGLFPVGALSMLFFRRPRAVAASAPALPSAQASSGTKEQESKPTDQAASPSVAAEPGRDAVLDTILSRLSALERNQARNPVAASLPRSRPAAAPSTTAPRDGEQLSARQLASLKGEIPLPSSAAAQAIGLRSAASLANCGARHGYRRGLCKQGSNGMVAIYSGLEDSPRGGKARRMWIVVPLQTLQG